MGAESLEGTSVEVQLARMEGTLGLIRQSQEHDKEARALVNIRLNRHSDRIDSLEKWRDVTNGERAGIANSIKAAWAFGGAMFATVGAVIGRALGV